MLISMQILFLMGAGLSHVSVSLCSPAPLSVCHLASLRSVGSKQAFSSPPSFKLQRGTVDKNDNQRQALWPQREQTPYTNICGVFFLYILCVGVFMKAAAKSPINYVFL